MLTGYTIVTRDPEFTDSDREHITALAAVRANECPNCGGPLDQTTDAEHWAWDVKHDDCNRCATVAYHQALDNGVKKDDAVKQGHSAGRLWRASPAPPGQVL